MAGTSPFLVLVWHLEADTRVNRATRSSPTLSSSRRCPSRTFELSSPPPLPTRSTFSKNSSPTTLANVLPPKTCVPHLSPALAPLTTFSAGPPSSLLPFLPRSDSSLQTPQTCRRTRTSRASSRRRRGEKAQERATRGRRGGAGCEEGRATVGLWVMGRNRVRTSDGSMNPVSCHRSNAVLHKCTDYGYNNKPAPLTPNQTTPSPNTPLPSSSPWRLPSPTSCTAPRQTGTSPSSSSSPPSGPHSVPALRDEGGGGRRTARRTPLRALRARTKGGGRGERQDGIRSGDGRSARGLRSARDARSRCRWSGGCGSGEGSGVEGLKEGGGEGEEWSAERGEEGRREGSSRRIRPRGPRTRGRGLGQNFLGGGEERGVGREVGGGGRGGEGMEARGGREGGRARTRAEGRRRGRKGGERGRGSRIVWVSKRRREAVGRTGGESCWCWWWERTALRERPCDVVLLRRMLLLPRSHRSSILRPDPKLLLHSNLLSSPNHRFSLPRPPTALLPHNRPR